MLKVLGALDILAAALLVLLSMGIFHHAIFPAAYLIAKGGFFTLSKDIASVADLFIGLALLFVFSKLFLLASAAFLLQKGILSMLE